MASATSAHAALPILQHFRATWTAMSSRRAGAAMAPNVRARPWKALRNVRQQHTRSTTSNGYLHHTPSAASLACPHESCSASAVLLPPRASTSAAPAERFRHRDLRLPFSGDAVSAQQGQSEAWRSRFLSSDLKLHARAPLLQSYLSLGSTSARAAPAAHLHTSPTRQEAAAEEAPAAHERRQRDQTHSSSSSKQQQEEAKPGLMGRLKELTKKYGWATIVVYTLFSLLDFSLVFFAINLIGAEHVRRVQDVVLDTLVYGRQGSRTVSADDGTPEGNGVLGFLKDWREKHKQKDREHALDADGKSGNGGNSSLWATAVLAYTIHKTLLLPVRLGATAATTPAIVKQLQKWGINIARNPIPEATRARGAQAIQKQKDKLDKARQRHGDWL